MCKGRKFLGASQEKADPVRMFTKIDDLARATWYRYLFNLWMMLRLNLVGAVFATIVAAIVVWEQEIDGSLAGFALSFALQFTVAVEWTIRQYSSTQLGMNSTERVLEYLEMETEDISGADVPASWPSEGVVESEGLVVGYAPGQAVLKGLSFKSERNQRIGVVGRTGAGKSTLALALFRFLNPSAGRIFIDGIDISTIKLADLRSRLAIVPQDPVLFSGSIRSNLDPFDEYTDEDLLRALAQVHIDSQSANAASSTQQTNTLEDRTLGSLSFPIAEGGHNLSQGQRQLLCLARATLSRRNFIVMDEATSSVDKATDMLIQRSIRERFQDCTLIVIAHRLSTVADFDTILVLNEGRVAEFEEPKVLMERKGVLWEMVQRSWDGATLEAFMSQT